MPSAIVPAEVWARVFFFVAPPLPYVGMETESFAEDAKGWRGDDDVKGQWKGIDALMLVSKHINELVSPVFWSYLVLTSWSQAAHLATCVHELSEGEQTSRYESVKVMRIFQEAQRPPYTERDGSGHPFLILLRRVTKVTHLHLDTNALERSPTTNSLLVALAMRLDGPAPLQGLTGLILGETNFDAATVALRHLAPCLRQLSVFALDEVQPASVAEDRLDRLPTVRFPNLALLATGSCSDMGAWWLQEVIVQTWHVPAITKLAIGAPPAEYSDFGEDARWWSQDCLHGRPVGALFKHDLNDVLGEFRNFAPGGVKELAFGMHGYDDFWTDYSAKEMDKAERGQCATIKVVVVVELARVGRLADSEDCCLAEIVNRRRLPSLEKVVWVSR